jgi:excisionase family DNA binding protein
MLNQGTDLEKFYTVKEFASLLRAHPHTVLKMIRENRLHPINIGSTIKPKYSIPEDDLLRLRAESFENFKK